ncbi:protein PRR14L isoform X2 [Bombina bombina]|uniref:protein PRR14L isoform X2 n=1 Tax=Bombina bombina TaxID=8345 RepID=UPI00235A9502|nr:protein PRR14L isoform X2 [Bombina bombina]
MLELQTLEQCHLHPLESSVSSAYGHLYPVLHMHLISEPVSSLGQESVLSGKKEKEQMPTRVGEVTQVNWTTEVKAEKRETLKENVAIKPEMLGTIERETSMEISQSAQSLLHKETGDSSDLQIKAEFLDIGIRHEHCSNIHIKEIPATSESVSKFTEDMDVVDKSTEEVLYSGQDKSLSVLQPDANRSETSDLEKTRSVKMALEMCSKYIADPQTSGCLSSGKSIDQECNLSTSCFEQPCQSPNQRQGGDASNHRLCLVDTFSSTRVPTACKENITEDSSISFSHSCSGSALEASSADILHEESLQGTLLKKGCCNSTESQLVGNPSCEKDQSQCESPVAHTCLQCSAENAAVPNVTGICLEHNPLHKISSTLFSSTQSSETFNSKYVCLAEKEHETCSTLQAVAHTENPRLPLDLLKSAKTLDTNTCSSSKSVHCNQHCRESADCDEQLPPVSNLFSSLAQKTDLDHTVAATVTCRVDISCVETTSYKRLVNLDMASTVVDVVSDALCWREEEVKATVEQLCQTNHANHAQGIENDDSSLVFPISDKSTIHQHVHISTEQPHSPHQENKSSSVVNRTVIDCQIQSDGPCETALSDASLLFPLSKGNAYSLNGQETNPIAVERINLDIGADNQIRCASELTRQQDLSILHFSSTNSLPEALKENLKSCSSEEVCQRAGFSRESLDSKTLTAMSIHDENAEPQYALVPYRGILAFLEKDKMPNGQSLEEQLSVFSSPIKKSHKRDLQCEREESMILEPQSVTLDCKAVQQILDKKMYEGKSCDNLQNDEMNVHIDSTVPLKLVDADVLSVQPSGCCASKELSKLIGSHTESQAQSPMSNILIGPVSVFSSCTELVQVIRADETEADLVTDRSKLTSPKHTPVNMRNPISRELEGVASDLGNPKIKQYSQVPSDTFLAEAKLPMCSSNCKLLSKDFTGQDHKLLSHNETSQALIIHSLIDTQGINERKCQSKNAIGSSQSWVPSNSHFVVSDELHDPLEKDVSPNLGPCGTNEKSTLSSEQSEGTEASRSPYKNSLDSGRNIFGVLCETYFTSHPKEKPVLDQIKAEPVVELEQTKRKRVCNEEPSEVKRSFLCIHKPLTKVSEEGLNLLITQSKDAEAITASEINEALNDIPEQKLEHPSLTTSSSSQTAKRAKIMGSKGNQSSLHTRLQPNVDSLNCLRVFPENSMKLRPRPLRLTSETDKLLPAISRRNSNSVKNICMKKQPSRKCKVSPVQDHILVDIQPSTNNSSILSMSSKVSPVQDQILVDIQPSTNKSSILSMSSKVSPVQDQILVDIQPSTNKSSLLRMSSKVSPVQDQILVDIQPSIHKSSILRMSSKVSPVQDHILLDIQPSTHKSSILSMSSEHVYKNKSIFLSKMDVSKPISKVTARSCLKLTRRRFATPFTKHRLLNKCSKLDASLEHLSSIASRLLTPCKNSSQLKSLSAVSELHPSNQGLFKVKKLLEVFSCVNMKLCSQSRAAWSKDPLPATGVVLPVSQRMDHSPMSPSKTTFLNLCNKFPLPLGDAGTFPFALHMNVDHSYFKDLIRLSPPVCVSKGLTSIAQIAEPFKWRLSLFVSSHLPCASESVQLKQQNVQFRNLEASRMDSNHRTSLRRFSGCSKHGLHTVLALSSPGCYRFWTRKRNLGSRVPTVQRLSMVHFAHGVNRLPTPNIRAQDPFSLPYLLGRVLSTWSQHGPSAFSSDCITSHDSYCLWQPCLGNISSSGPLPSMTPLLMNTQLSRLDIQRLPENSPTLSLIPKICRHHEDPVPPYDVSSSKAQVCPFEQQEALAVSHVRVQLSNKENEKEILEKKPQRVSQIRIRKTVPKPDPNLTPMGLPKAKRLKKKEFSLEDIYTNKNYQSPPAARSLETIFEEPKEKNGILISVSQQKRKRILEFRDFTVPRLKRTKGKLKVFSACKRGRKAAAIEEVQLDALLIEKLMELENFFLQEEAVERSPGTTVILS